MGTGPPPNCRGPELPGQEQRLQVQFTDPGRSEPGGGTHRKLPQRPELLSFWQEFPRQRCPAYLTSAALFCPQHLAVVFCLCVSLHLCPRE